MASDAVHKRQIIHWLWPLFMRTHKWLYGVSVLGLCGCLQGGQPTIAERSATPQRSVYVVNPDGVRRYTVEKGDTLYAIAWRFELDYRGLAAANAIVSPYTIYPGQLIDLTVQHSSAAPAAGSKPRPKPGKPSRVPPKSAPLPSEESVDWVWPLTDTPKVLFGAKVAGGGSSKGLDFHLTKGRRSKNVQATAAGDVVYAGSGIGGFERLIIIKHSADLLSAYGFDGTLLAKEGQRVLAGAHIAAIRNRGAGHSALHFELRKKGKPIDPVPVLGKLPS